MTYVFRAIRRQFRLLWEVGAAARSASRDSASQRDQGIEPRRSLQAVLNAFGLSFSRQIAGSGNAIDIARDDLARCLQAVKRLSSKENANCFVLLDGFSRVNVRRKNVFQLLLRVWRRGLFRLLLLDPNGRIQEVVEVRVWEQRQDYWITADVTAPIKRVPARADVRSANSAEPSQPVKGRRTDASYEFPVDFVYTWVNASDPEWRRMAAPYLALNDVDGDRFSQHDELRYSLRSVAQNAPWARRILIFSNCRPPDWWAESDRCRWIMHDEVMPAEHLPTFNSHAIETYLHRLPGLSEHFIYMNDDFALADRTEKRDHFRFDGRTIAKLEPHGLVNYFDSVRIEARDDEWKSAAINGARLLEKRFGYFPTRLHQHSPYSLRQSLLQDLEEWLPSEFRLVRANRFRSNDDISVPSFLFHHYAYAIGQAEIAESSGFLVRPSNHRSFERGLRRGRSYKTICINDGDQSSGDLEFTAFKKRFLPTAYPFKSCFEHAEAC